MRCRAGNRVPWRGCLLGRLVPDPVVERPALFTHIVRSPEITYAGLPKQALKKSNHPVFRPGALREYVRGREETVLPRFVSRRAIARLWLGTALVVVVGAMLLVFPVSLTAYGTVLATMPGEFVGVHEGNVVAVAVPSNLLTRVRLGGAVYLGETRNREDRGQIVELASPLGSSATMGGNQSGDRVIIVRFPVGAKHSATTEECRMHGCRVQVEMGRTTFWSFLLGSDRASTRSY